MIKKIVILVKRHFNKWEYKRDGVADLEKNGFMVEVWNLAPILYPHIKRENVISPHDKVEQNLRIYHKKKDVVKALRCLDISETLLILFLDDFRPGLYFVYREIFKRKLIYARIKDICTHSRDKNKLKDIMKRFFSLKVWRYQFYILWIKMQIELSCANKALDILLIGCEKHKDFDVLVGNKTKILYHHVNNYDIYLSSKNDASQYDKTIAVYLDSCLPFHPDSLYQKRKLYLPSTAEFYLSFRKFFDYLEQLYKVRIVIAAHPRSNYKNLPRYFGEREIVYGKTCALTKNCQFVMAHESTAIDFAVLYRKPLMFLTSDIIDRNYCRESIYNIAEFFGKYPINIDHDYQAVDLEKELIVNDVTYDEYKRKYIKHPGSSDVPLWQYFADKVKELYP